MRQFSWHGSRRGIIKVQIPNGSKWNLNVSEQLFVDNHYMWQQEAAVKGNALTNSSDAVASNDTNLTLFVWDFDTYAETTNFACHLLKAFPTFCKSPCIFFTFACASDSFFSWSVKSQTCFSSWLILVCTLCEVCEILSRASNSASRRLCSSCTLASSFGD